MENSNFFSYKSDTVIAGSVSIGSPTKKSRGKVKMSEEEGHEPYKPEKVKVMGTCFVNK